MGLDATTRRRCLGVLALAGALLMLVGGETILSRMSPGAFLIYWLGCFALTITAMVVALLDVRALRRRTHEEQRRLFETTLKALQTEAKPKPRSPQKSG